MSASARSNRDKKYPQLVTAAPTPANFAGRIPPQNLQAEEAILGSILLENEAVNGAAEILQAHDFYKPQHAAIYEAMLALLDRHEPIDILTLSQELKTKGTLDSIGGVERLSQLATIVPSSANVSYYAKLVKETSLRRRTILGATEIIANAYQEGLTVAEFLDYAEQKILDVSDYRIKAAFVPVGSIVQSAITQIEYLYDRKELVTGAPSGFTDLDKITAGFQQSDLIVLAARPSMGKTSLALQLAQYSGIQCKKAVAVFSLEMSKEQLVLRMLCSEAQVDNSRVRTGHLVEKDFPRLVDAASRLAEAEIFIDDTPAITITELRAKARRLHREHPLTMVVVDYLQLVRSPAYSQAREQEIADISRSLKALAKELSLPVIALSQLNRSLESRNDKRPMMSDLRESGAIEQDADLIMFIYRDEVYNHDTVDKGVAEILISKHRSGPTGAVKLSFMPQYTRFENLAAGVSEHDVSNAEAHPAEIVNLSADFQDDF